MIELTDSKSPSHAYCDDCYQELPLARFITYHDRLGTQKILPMMPEDDRSDGTEMGFVTLSPKPKRFLCIKCCPETVSVYGYLFRKNTSGCFMELGSTFKNSNSCKVNKVTIIKPQLIRKTQL